MKMNRVKAIVPESPEVYWIKVAAVFLSSTGASGSAELRTGDRLNLEHLHLLHQHHLLKRSSRGEIKEDTFGIL